MVPFVMRRVTTSPGGIQRDARHVWHGVWHGVSWRVACAVSRAVTLSLWVVRHVAIAAVIDVSIAVPLSARRPCVRCGNLCHAHQFTCGGAGPWSVAVVAALSVFPWPNATCAVSVSPVVWRCVVSVLSMVVSCGAVLRLLA